MVDRETHVEAAAAAVGAGLGLVAGPPGSIAGALAAPYLAAVGLQFYDRIRGRRVDDTHRALAEAGISPDRLARLLEEDERVWDLYQTAVDASLRTSFDRKRKVLGELLVRGLLSSAGWARDREIRVMHGLAAVEEADLLLLEFVSSQPEREIAVQGVSERVSLAGGCAELAELHAAFDHELVDFVIEKLERAGLLDPIGLRMFGSLAVWAPSTLGRVVLREFSRGAANNRVAG